MREITGFFFPYDVAVDPKNGNVYVVSPFSAQVTRFSKTGNYIDDWTVAGADTDLQSVVVDPRRQHIFLTDDVNDRVVVHTRQNDFVREWDSWTGGSVSAFAKPFGITATKSRVYVTDAMESTVFEFTRGGVYTGETSGGSEPLSSPYFAGVNKAGTRLSVSDISQNEVSRFRL